MTYSILIALQVVIALVLIGLILVQHGKGADAGAAFGSGASGTVFGAKGSANFMSHATAGLATVFFLLSLALAYMIGGNTAPTGNSVTQQLQQQSAVTQSVQENTPRSAPESAAAAATNADQAASGASAAQQGAKEDTKGDNGGVTAQVPE